MGKVRTSSVKTITRAIFKEYVDYLTLDFDHNKDIVSKVAVTHSKSFRNRVAGYLTAQMKLKKKREEDY